MLDRELADPEAMSRRRPLRAAAARGRRRGAPPSSAVGPRARADRAASPTGRSRCAGSPSPPARERSAGRARRARAWCSLPASPRPTPPMCWACRTTGSREAAMRAALLAVQGPRHQGADRCRRRGLGPRGLVRDGAAVGLGPLSMSALGARRPRSAEAALLTDAGMPGRAGPRPRRGPHHAARAGGRGRRTGQGLSSRRSARRLDCDMVFPDHLDGRQCGRRGERRGGAHASPSRSPAMPAPSASTGRPG